MFEKFGEFDSYVELNNAAEGLFNEGDAEGLRILAKENGIDAEFVQMYLDGDIMELCDAQTAAAGKMEVEMAHIKKSGKVDVDMAQTIADYMMSLAADTEKYAIAIRRKGKTVEGCIEKMRQIASKKPRKGNMVCIAPAEGFKIIREYYEV